MNKNYFNLIIKLEKSRLIGNPLKQKEKDKLAFSIREAMNNLSVIADLDFEGKAPIGIVKNHRFVLQDEDLTYNTVDWMTEENAEEILENIKLTYKAILRYLHEIYEEKMTNWNDVHTKKGLQTVMAMAAEAAFKLDNYIGGIKGIEDYKEVSRCDEYEKIKEFYLTKIAKKFDGGLEGEKVWQQQWNENRQAINLDLEKRGLKDFETVLKDNEYELFYLKDDEEKPFFDLSLIRNIKLFCDFDESISVDLEDDPLIQLHHFYDKDLQISAKQILHFTEPVLKKFCKEKISPRRNNLSSALFKAMYALMLAANSENLIENSLGKSSSQYFQDYLGFLREALHSIEYQKMLAYPEDKTTQRNKTLLELAHHLCLNTYMRKGGVKEEVIGFIYRLIRKGAEKKGEMPSKRLNFWQRLLEEDENMRFLLKMFPNGPLFKDLDVLREIDEEELSFEPWMQNNVPMKVYEIKTAKAPISFLHLPCPTKQFIISRAHINPEYKGFLYTYVEKKKKHLLINLQDRTSWKEFARCQLLEKLSQEAEFSSSLMVVSLPSATPFYYQTQEYYESNSAKEFIEQFSMQLKNFADCGYYFPSSFAPLFETFYPAALKTIHEKIFGKKNLLTRKERLDFIETFHHLLLLKIIEHFGPDSMSFTCKDGVDIGSAYSASFFSFIKLITNKKLKKSDEDLFLWLMYNQAFIVRERPVNVQRLHRTLSFISYFNDELSTHEKKVMSAVNELIDASFIKKLAL